MDPGQRQSMLKAFQTIAEGLQKEYAFSLAELTAALKAEDNSIPATAFNSKLTPFETASRYLEQSGKNIDQISDILGRPPSVVKKTLDNSRKKLSGVIKPEDTDYTIPANIFADKTNSFSAQLCLYLKNTYGLSNATIAKQIGLDPRTVWTVLNRARGGKQ